MHKFLQVSVWFKVDQCSVTFCNIHDALTHNLMKRTVVSGRQSASVFSFPDRVSRLHNKWPCHWLSDSVTFDLGTQREILMHVSMMYLSLMHVSMRQSVAVPEFFRVPVLIFGIKFFRHRFRYFFCTKFYLYRFRYLVSVLNFSGVRYHLKPKKNPGTGMPHSAMSHVSTMHVPMMWGHGHKYKCILGFWFLQWPDPISLWLTKVGRRVVQFQTGSGSLKYEEVQV